MKKTLLTLATLSVLFVAPPLVHADNTNSPVTATNGIAKPYPLNYCLVSGDKLDGDMGKPVVLVYQGQEFKFCCHDCVKEFNKDPDKYVKKLQTAEKKAIAGGK